MASQSPPRRVNYPTGQEASGPLFKYLTAMAQALNAIPTFSVTSYAGGPESNVTGAQGDCVSNVISAAQAARFYVKEQGSGTTGWVSFVTQGHGSAILAAGQATLSLGSVIVNNATVTSGASIFLSDAGGGSHIGSVSLNGVTSGASFAILSSNALDTSAVNWLILGPS